MYVHINSLIRVPLLATHSQDSLWLLPLLLILHVSPYSSYLHLLPNTADQWRVILKTERLDYINASFVNVGIKHVHFKIYPYNDIMLSLCRATSSKKDSLLHRHL